MAGCTCATCEGARAYSRAQRGDPRRIAAYQKYREGFDEPRLAHEARLARQRTRARAEARDAARLAELHERNSQS